MKLDSNIYVIYQDVKEKADLYYRFRDRNCELWISSDKNKLILFDFDNECVDLVCKHFEPDKFNRVLRTIDIAKEGVSHDLH